MKNTIIAYFAFGLWACTNPPPQASVSQLSDQIVIPVTYTGLIRHQDSLVQFMDCADQKTYVVLDSTHKLAQRIKEANVLSPCAGEPVWAQVKGKMTRNGSVLLITAIDSIAGINKLNTCIPFDFWCSGTEPFWSVAISKNLKSACFKRMGDEEGQSFVYSEPTKQPDQWVYQLSSISDPDQTLMVSIKQEPCSDGMSDIKYAYSVALVYKGKKWAGCAEKWGELAKE